MIFGLRFWAYRVVERAGYRVPTALGVSLVQALVDGAKSSRRLRRGGNRFHILNAALELEARGASDAPLITADVAAKASQAARELDRRARLVGELRA